MISQSHNENEHFGVEDNYRSHSELSQLGSVFYIVFQKDLNSFLIIYQDFVADAPVSSIKQLHLHLFPQVKLTLPLKLFAHRSGSVWCSLPAAPADWAVLQCAH